MSGLQSRWVSAAGFRIHYLASPHPHAEPPIVLVHGMVVSSRYMVPTARLLARSHRVLAPDLPGFGRTEKPEWTLSLSNLADALSAWMDALGLPPAVLLGNSVGCQILAELALRHPERAAGFIMVSPTIDREARSITGQFQRLNRTMMHEPLIRYLPVLARDYLDAGTRRAVETFRRALDDAIEDKLPLIPHRTLVVHGTLDRLSPERWAREVAHLLPNGRLVVIPGGAHAINFGAPLELTRVMRPFLREVREAWLASLLPSIQPEATSLDPQPELQSGDSFR